MVRSLPRLRRVQHDGGGAERARARWVPAGRRPRRRRGRGRQPPGPPRGGLVGGRRADPDRDRRAGPRPGRRPRPRLAGPHRRRSRHRQEHIAHTGLPCARRGRRPRALRLRRGIGGAGEAAGRPARRRGAGNEEPLPPGRDGGGGDRGPGGRPRAARPDGGLDPDCLPRDARVRSGQREPGAGVGCAAHDAGEIPRPRRLPGRPRDEGGRAGGAPRARAPRSTRCSTSRASGTRPIGCCGR